MSTRPTTARLMNRPGTRTPTFAVLGGLMLVLFVALSASLATERADAGFNPEPQEASQAPTAKGDGLPPFGPETEPEEQPEGTERLRFSTLGYDNYIVGVHDSAGNVTIMDDDDEESGNHPGSIPRTVVFTTSIGQGLDMLFLDQDSPSTRGFCFTAQTSEEFFESVDVTITDPDGTQRRKSVYIDESDGSVLLGTSPPGGTYKDDECRVNGSPQSRCERLKSKLIVFRKKVRKARKNVKKAKRSDATKAKVKRAEKKLMQVKQKKRKTRKTKKKHC